MLPSLLNSSYDKILYPQPSLDPTLKVKLLVKKNEVSFSSLDAADQAQVMRLVRKGDLVLEYKAKDKKQIKTEKWYRVNQEGLKELQLSARAKKKASIERAPVTRARGATLSRIVSGFFTRSSGLFY